MTKIESWLRGKQVAWNKDVEVGFEDAPQNAKAVKDAVENFIEFAFSDDICFLDEDEDEEGFDPSEHMEPPPL